MTGLEISFYLLPFVYREGTCVPVPANLKLQEAVFLHDVPGFFSSSSCPRRTHLLYLFWGQGMSLSG